jgi:hypothetical protein
MFILLRVFNKLLILENYFLLKEQDELEKMELVIRESNLKIDTLNLKLQD